MKHKARRVLSLLLTLSMLCSLLCTTALATDDESVPWSGNGTLADPYLIKNTADLWALSNSINSSSTYRDKYFKLESDLEVSDWEPIGYNASYYFAGDFDGNGHTVTINGITQANSTYSAHYIGLFGYLSGVVHDVTVDGTVAYTDTTYGVYAGGIAGYLKGTSSSAPAALVNCVNKAAINANGKTSSSYSGGIVAYGYTNSYMCNCYSTGSVLGGRFVGSLVGYANSGTYEYCFTTATPAFGYKSTSATASTCYADGSANTSTTGYTNAWSDVSTPSTWVSGGNALAVSSGYSTVANFWSLDSDFYPTHVNSSGHQHTASGAGVVTAPTCTEQGYTTYTCATCGESYQDDYVDALGHDLETVTVGATCTEPGSVTETCSREGCDYTSTSEIPALGHDYVNGYCTRCGAAEPTAEPTAWTVTIGTGTSSDRYIPYNGSYSYSLWEGIYTAQEVGDAGTITQIAFQVATASSISTTSVKIYLGHTSKTGIDSSTDWIAAGDLTLVYEGAPTLGSETGWETIALDTPFEYNGTDNLVVAVSKSTANSTSGLYYYYTTTSSRYAGMYRSSDSTASYADYSNVDLSGYRQLKNPNIQLTMEESCAHENKTNEVYVAATCTEDGYHSFHCEDCGQDILITLPALGHNYVNGYCTRCGEAEPVIQTVTIGTGTTTSHSLPYDNYYKYSLTETIYTAQEIGTAGNITEIAYQVSTASSFNASSVKIYMGHTSKSVFSSASDWMAAADLTLVYEGALTLGLATGWESITLDTPFVYNGTDNLVIAISKTAENFNGSLYYYCSTTAGNTVLYRQSDSATTYPNYDNLSNSGYTTTTRPDIQLCIENGSASGTTTYEIGTQAALLEFAQKVANGEYYANAKLTADITLTGNWTPMGTAAMPYTGTFDGDGHTISGLYINSDAEYAGLFGRIDGATIKNLVVKGYVRSTETSGSAGAVAAHASGSSTFTNVGNEAIVISGNTATTYYAVGGILGCVETGGTVVFESCYNKGGISAASGYVGGIVGGPNSNSTGADITLTNCYNLGSVSKTAQSGGYAGGIIGFNYQLSAELTNCYNLGDVTEGCGELAGNVTSGSVGTNCYTSESTGLTAAALGTGYQDGSDINVGSSPALAWESESYVAPVTLTGITVTTQPAKTTYTTTESFDPSGMVVTAHYSDSSSETVTDYTWSPSGNLTTDDTEITISYNDYRTVIEDVTATVPVTVTQVIRTVTFQCGTGAYVYIGSGGTGYEILGDDPDRPTGVEVYDGYPLLFLARADNGYVVDTVTANGATLVMETDGDGNNYYHIESVTANAVITVTAVLAEYSFTGTGDDYGSGTADDPYLIQNETDLRTLAENVNDGAGYHNTFFKMTADIGLTGAWTPIGNNGYYGSAFMGTFDGDGHTVSGLSILLDDVDQAQEIHGYGLFGVVSGATIKNLAVSGEVTNVAQLDDTGYRSYFGGIVGVAASVGVTLENCASHVDVTNMYYRNTSSDLSQLDESYVGGLVGYCDGVLSITNSYSDGMLINRNASSYGLDEEGTYTWVGGLVGGFYNYGDTSSEITNSFAYGTITGGYAGRIAPIIASNESAATVEDCYYLDGIAAGQTGATATSESSFLTLASTLNGSGNSGPFCNGVKHPIFTWETENEAAPGVTADTSWYDSSKTAFTLTTKEQLFGLAKLVNSGTTFEGKIITLSGDIALTGEWTPIGTENNHFCGTFNGQFHTVSGLNVDRKATLGYNGLFGYIENATVEKLFVTGSVSGGNYTGGIVGYARDSVVQYCGNEATVSGRGHVGGVVGHGHNATILACYNRSSVTNDKLMNAMTGGIVGYLYDSDAIQYCYNTGNVTLVTTASNIDGEGGTDLNYVYTGGIAGMSYSDGILNCYSAGTISGGGALYTGGLLGSGNMYYQQDSFSYYLSGSASSGVGDKEDSEVYFQSASVQELQSTTSTVAQNLSANFVADEDNVNNGYLVLAWELDPSVLVSYVTEIYTAADLYTFANNVQAGHDYTGETVYLMNSIDLGGLAEQADGTYAPVTDKVWTAIGSMTGGNVDYAFCGTFDGQGYTVSGVYLANSNSGYQGLFSILPEGAVVKNLTVSGLASSSQSNVGGIVGWNLGTVENCVSNVDITVSGSTYVGGIAADNAGTITGCVNNGTISSTNNVSSYSYVGGITGHVEPAFDAQTNEQLTTPVVANCVNNGDVTATAGGTLYVGGIVGAEFNDYGACASVTGSVNHGDISSTDYAGGIVGYMSAGSSNYDAIALADSYNTGDVYGRNYAGGILGYANLGELTISSCFSTGEITGLTGAYVGEIAGYTKADVKNSYYVLDISTEQTSVGYGSGDNYARPVAYAYMDTDDFEEMIGYSYTLAEPVNENETAEFYAYDIFTINVVTTTASATPAAQSDDGPETSASASGTTVTITRLSGAHSYSLTGFNATRNNVTTYFSVTDKQGKTYGNGYPALEKNVEVTTKDTYGCNTQAVFTFATDFPEATLEALAAPKEIEFSIVIKDTINTDGTDRTYKDLGSFTMETYFTVTQAANATDAYTYTVRQSRYLENESGYVEYNGIAVQYVTLENLLSKLGFTVVKTGSTITDFTYDSVSAAGMSFTPIDAVLPQHTRDLSFGNENEDLDINNAVLVIQGYQRDPDAGKTQFESANRLNAVRLITRQLYTTPAESGEDVSNSVKWISKIGVTYLLGDLNGDGSITSADAALILNYISNPSSLTTLQLALADVNGDGNVDNADRLAINAYVTGGNS